MEDAAEKLVEELSVGQHAFSNAELRLTFGTPRITSAARETIADALEAAGLEILSDPETAPLVVRKTAPDVSPPGAPTKGGRRALVWVGAGAVAILILAAVASGAFLLGQSTRKSDAVVALEQQAAVKDAVVVAVRENNDEQRAVRKRALERAEASLKRRNRVVIRRVVRRLKKSAEQKANASFASGSQAGYATGAEAGFEEGEEAGLIRGSDELVCSDDSDVPLPAC